MAKKTPQQPSGDNSVPPAAPAEASTRPGSRHKPRKMISLSTRQYEAVKVLARRNKRPVSWEVRIAINAALVEAGLMTPEDAAAIERDA